MKKKAYNFITNSAVLLLLLSLCSCREEDSKTAVPAPQSQNDALLAGKLTVNDLSENAFGNEVPGLTSDESNIFVVGNSFFRTNWVTAPASTTARDGLGPFLNAQSCGACHPKDGRGQPPSAGDTDMRALLFRLSVDGSTNTGAPMPHPEYGGQLQPLAIIGVLPEGQPLVQYIEQQITFSDGQKTAIRVPRYTFTTNYSGNLDNAHISPRVGNQLCGVGLLEAIPEQTILSWADEFDKDGDGISGRPNYVWDYNANTKRLGRFGWKANQPSLKQQVAGAFNGDMGITTSLFNQEEYPTSFADKYKDIPNGGTPEITDNLLDKVTFYCQTLAVPARRNVKDKEVIAGEVLFAKIGCNQCHKDKVTTSMIAVPSILSNIDIKPYTDMLLHDMGDGLADGRADFEANSNEWRTTPLWGIGMIQTVNGHSFLLHDGRARNIEEAILWHEGEAENTKTKYTKLSKIERQQLISFVNTL